MSGVKRSRHWEIVRLLLAVVLFAMGTILLELSFSLSRYDLVEVTEEAIPDILRIEEIPTAAPNVNDTQNGTKYLAYDENFTYPLNLNLVSLINDAIMYRKHIPIPAINPHPYPYLVKPASCLLPEKFTSDKKILVLVKSYIGNVDQRIALRMLWEKVQDPLMSKFFVLGTYRKGLKIKRWHIEQETALYRDIIMEDFVDTYMNNTIKTIMAFNWAMSVCPQADLILFHDDDYHVQYDKLASYIRELSRSKVTGLYIGSLAVNAPPYREKNDRWYLSYDDYPYNIFPPYIGGGAFVVSRDVAQKFQFAFPFVRYLGIDDVYLGIVARKLSILPKNESRLDTICPETFAKECSHDAEKLLIENCTLAINKREITALRIKMEKYMKEREVEKVDIKFIDTKTYLSFDHNFSYPLKINMQAYVNGRLRNKLKTRYNAINIFHYKISYNPSECVFKPSKIYNKNILILVKSYVKNFQQREVIRQMWNSSSTSKKDMDEKLVFLLAFGLQNTTQLDIHDESERYGDILQARFIDQYKNNTLKTMMAYNWAMEKCSKADLLLFLDDDFYVHRRQLLTHLRGIPKQRYLYMGNVMKDQLPYRGKGHRWSLDADEYPFDKLPLYANGGAYVVSSDVAQRFQIAFPYVKYLAIDDVFVGIVAKKLHIVPRHDELFDQKQKNALVYECSHIPSRLLLNQCPLSGRMLISNTTKLVERNDSFWNKIRLFNSYFFNKAD
ncbi:uncharacterized protein [Argopecten irradians]|uniref:uncharacterized protein n=1 Tax=Argopecten irradians TaxID=31199 RepID=UPI003721D072